MRQHPRDTSTSPARGVLFGLLVSFALWIPIVALVSGAFMIGAERDRLTRLGSQEAFASFRTSNGGVVR